MALVLRQAAAQQPQSALPHLGGQRASRGQELGAPAALHVPHPQRLSGARLKAAPAHRIEDENHTQPREQQDGPAGGGGEMKQNIYLKHVSDGDGLETVLKYEV